MAEAVNAEVVFLGRFYLRKIVRITLFATGQNSFVTRQMAPLLLAPMCGVVTFVVALIDRSPGNFACQTVSTSLPP